MLRINSFSGLNLKVIPVIDVLNGIVVHAIKGRRKEYKPLKSILISSIQPLKIAKMFRDFGFSELYLADLDAIINGTINPELLKSISKETGLKLMVDAGVTNIEKTKKLLDNGVNRVIIGTETLEEKNFLGKAVTFFGSDRIILSLDLSDGEVLFKWAGSRFDNAASLLQEFSKMGVSDAIILDLARVGSSEGVDTDFLKRLIKVSSMNLYVGGGVKDISELLKLKELGVSGALVATALHSGKVSVGDLKRASLL